jgi:hypothetical protein
VSHETHGEDAMMLKRLTIALAAGMLAVGFVRGGSVKVDFNPKAEFERYRTWAWAPERDEEHHGVLADATLSLDYSRRSFSGP